jgi:tetratricopeptide (TPR) repeat protein
MGNREFSKKLMAQAVNAALDKSKPSNLTTAYQLWASACIADPTFADALYQYANNNFDLKKIEAAMAGYRRALHCEVTNEMRARVMINLGWCYHLAGKTQEALNITIGAGKLYPDLTQYWLHLSVLKGLFGDTRASVDCARKAVELSIRDLQCVIGVPDDALAGYQRQLLESKIALAFSLLFDGQYEEAYDLFELRFEWRLHSFLQLPYPRWLGEPDKMVFLVADQGLGDTISYMRFVEETCRRAKYVYAYIQPQLMRLFSLSLGHLPNLSLLPQGSPYPPADCWSTFVSLPFALKLTSKQVAEFKQPKVPVLPSPTDWMVPDTKLHIGIAWSGSPANDINKDRNIPLKYFLELYRVPGVQLYALQKDDAIKELHDSGCVSLVRDLTPYINDVCDTISLLKHLDLVICCESALGHICALAGRECWVPYSWMGRDYRIGATGEKLMWTPKTRVFRQGPEIDWGPVFEDIIEALQEKLSEQKQRAVAARGR